MKYLPSLLFITGCAGQVPDKEYYKVTAEVLVGQKYVESMCDGAAGCAHLLADKCIIVIGMLNDFDLIGHEFLHCMIGNFH